MSFLNKVIIGVLIVGAVFTVSQFMYLLPLHITSFVVTITAVIIADVHALLWTLGKIPILPRKRMVFLHYLVGVGLFTSIVSGAIMFWPLQDYLLTVPAFWAKMTFVLALVINSFIISKHLHTSITRSFSSLTKKERLPLFVSGGVSAVGWAGAFVSALFLGL